MSLTADRKQIRAELAELEEAEMRARRHLAATMVSRELQQQELDAIIAKRKGWQELLAKQVNRESR